MRLFGLELVVTGLYIEKMEVSINFLIHPGHSSQELLDFIWKNPRPCYLVQPPCLQLTISYLSQST